MNTRTEREMQDILQMVEDRNYYYALPEYRKTVAVSLAAVALCGKNLWYVPENVITKEFEGRAICRTALAAKDADCTILPCIPFPDVQKEGIQRLLGNNEPPFVVYSFVDMQDAKMAQDAVKADAYCIHLVPDSLLSRDLCRTALHSPNTDEKVQKFVMERFPELKTEQMQKTEKPQQARVKMKF
jgi:hypothetical protein